ncbi:hypothetical protein GCM10027280_58200 [Micromonospora polyrhachis]|uniref:Uncharacterized protein n=1 Tax=Micromonospora polyrhachis TaxID=1282883 RepID=A0A7W7WNU9_9ACTN|nr:hypothetical protein [Micromonospora polyrhachis]MBB4957964.1 hypothetical protein [Micromonospora polyrhachis]
MKAFLPWLTVLAVIMLLNALRLRPLATAVAVGWLGYCIWTWVRGSRADRGSNAERHGRGKID